MGTNSRIRPAPRSIKVSVELDEWIAARAERAGCSWSEYVRRVVQTHRLKVDKVAPLPTEEDVRATREETA